MEERGDLYSPSGWDFSGREPACGPSHSDESLRCGHDVGRRRICRLYFSSLEMSCVRISPMAGRTRNFRWQMSGLPGPALHTLAFKRWEMDCTVTPELLELKVQADSRGDSLTVRTENSFLVKVRAPAKDGRYDAQPGSQLDLRKQPRRPVTSSG
jgi:hypothetical protein